MVTGQIGLPQSTVEMSYMFLIIFWLAQFDARSQNGCCLPDVARTPRQIVYLGATRSDPATIILRSDQQATELEAAKRLASGAMECYCPQDLGTLLLAPSRG